MRKLFWVALTLCFVAIGMSSVHAGVWIFRPDPIDMFDLDHRWAYTWGIDWDQYEEVTDVTLTFKNIQDYVDEPDDILYMRLLDNAAPGVTSYWDNQAIGDYFEGQGVLFDTWSDPNGYPAPPVDLTISLTDLGFLDEFNNFASDGNFGLAFDPDCHYWNDGIELRVETAIPEPGTLSLLLLGFSMVGTGMIRRKRK